jgi:hypothetical protein
MFLDTDPRILGQGYRGIRIAHAHINVQYWEVANSTIKTREMIRYQGKKKERKIAVVSRSKSTRVKKKRLRVSPKPY